MHSHVPKKAIQPPHRWAILCMLRVELYNGTHGPWATKNGQIKVLTIFNTKKVLIIFKARVCSSNPWAPPVAYKRPDILYMATLLRPHREMPIVPWDVRSFVAQTHEHHPLHTKDRTFDVNATSHPGRNSRSTNARIKINTLHDADSFAAHGSCLSGASKIVARSMQKNRQL